MKKIIGLLCIFLIFIQVRPMQVYAENTELTAQAAILMEADSGRILYEKESHKQMSPASITKIMTLLLIFDALSSGKITLTDSVTTSAYAKSMGGSQVFLEEGEMQDVDTMIKCIVIASGNDASAAMAEYIAGTEEAFVAMMNEKAQTLGMADTHFVDCCGLSDSDEHYTSAYDIALMARALITQYPQISDYATVWMTSITHVTKQGSSEFGLSNTNRLLKMANNFKVTGLKTGSTAKAGYCFCGTAKANGVDLIAVVMHSADYKVRFKEAQQLLNEGFARCVLYQDDDPPKLPLMAVSRGTIDETPLVYDAKFRYVCIDQTDTSGIQSELILEDAVSAPFESGTEVGRLVYTSGGQTIGEVAVRTELSAKKAGFSDYFLKIYNQFLSIC